MKILPTSIIMLSTVCAAVYGFNKGSPIGNCPGCRKFDVTSFEPLKRVAIIKAEILRRLNISQHPSGYLSTSQSQQPTELAETRQKNADLQATNSGKEADDTQELSEILSYSELPGWYHDNKAFLFQIYFLPLLLYGKIGDIYLIFFPENRF